MRILVTRPIPESAVELLRNAGHEVTVSPHDRPLSPQELLAGTEGKGGLIAMLTDRIDAAFLDARPNIRAVANFAVGYNNIDVAACTQRNVGASNTPDVLNDATAEVAWTLMLAAARRAGESERVLRAKQWKGWGPLQFIGVPVIGRTLGIVGAGRIGSRVAELSRGFDMQVIYHNRNTSPAMEKLGAKRVELRELLAAADFVSIHVPLTEQTRHLIGAKELASMKKTAVLVNTSRGPVVDEAALVEALRSGRIFAAGLDVYEQEPTVHPGLFELENAVIFPHIGSATTASRTGMAELAAENLVEMLAGRRGRTQINA
jgi:glyoxylate reductase